MSERKGEQRLVSNEYFHLATTWQGILLNSELSVSEKLAELSELLPEYGDVDTDSEKFQQICKVVNLVDHDDNTALHLAMGYNGGDGSGSPLVSKLLNYGASTEKKNLDDKLPSQCYFKLVGMDIIENARKFIFRDDDEGLLNIINDHPHIVNCPVHPGSQIWAMATLTLLHYAIARSPKCLELLLQRNADPNIPLQDVNKCSHSTHPVTAYLARTSKGVSAETGKEIGRILIMYGADINIPGVRSRLERDYSNNSFEKNVVNDLRCDWKIRYSRAKSARNTLSQTLGSITVMQTSDVSSKDIKNTEQALIGTRQWEVVDNESPDYFVVLYSSLSKLEEFVLVNIERLSESQLYFVCTKEVYSLFPDIDSCNVAAIGDEITTLQGQLAEKLNRPEPSLQFMKTSVLHASTVVQDIVTLTKKINNQKSKNIEELDVELGQGDVEGKQEDSEDEVRFYDEVASEEVDDIADREYAAELDDSKLDVKNHYIEKIDEYINNKKKEQENQLEKLQNGKLGAKIYKLLVECDMVFSHNEKINAATALKTSINTGDPILCKYEGALNDGRLGELFNDCPKEIPTIAFTKPQPSFYRSPMVSWGAARADNPSSREANCDEEAGITPASASSSSMN